MVCGVMMVCAESVAKQRRLGCVCVFVFVRCVWCVSCLKRVLEQVETLLLSVETASSDDGKLSRQVISAAERLPPSVQLLASEKLLQRSSMATSEICGFPVRCFTDGTRVTKQNRLVLTHPRDFSVAINLFFERALSLQRSDGSPAGFSYSEATAIWLTDILANPADVSLEHLTHLLQDKSTALGDVVLGFGRLMRALHQRSNDQWLVTPPTIRQCLRDAHAAAASLRLGAQRLLTLVLNVLPPLHAAPRTNVIDAIEASLFTEVASTLEPILHAATRDESFDRRIESLAKAPHLLATRLGLPKRWGTDPEPMLRAAVVAAREMPLCPTPRAKLFKFLEVCYAASRAGVADGVPALGADDLLPACAFALVSARLTELQTMLFQLKLFVTDENELLGRLGYAMATLEAATSFISSVAVEEAALEAERAMARAGSPIECVEDDDENAAAAEQVDSDDDDDEVDDAAHEVVGQAAVPSEEVVEATIVVGSVFGRCSADDASTDGPHSDGGNTSMSGGTNDGSASMSGGSSQRPSFQNYVPFRSKSPTGPSSPPLASTPTGTSLAPPRVDHQKLPPPHAAMAMAWAAAQASAGWLDDITMAATSFAAPKSNHLRQAASARARPRHKVSSAVGGVRHLSSPPSSFPGSMDTVERGRELPWPKPKAAEEGGEGRTIDVEWPSPYSSGEHPGAVLDLEWPSPPAPSGINDAVIRASESHIDEVADELTAFEVVPFVSVSAGGEPALYLDNAAGFGVPAQAEMALSPSDVAAAVVAAQVEADGSGGSASTRRPPTVMCVPTITQLDNPCGGRKPAEPAEVGAMPMLHPLWERFEQGF